MNAMRRSSGQHAAAAPLNVLVADDQEVARIGVSALIARMPGMRVLAEAEDGDDLLALLEVVRPDVVVTDIAMPRLDGLAATAQIRKHYPAVQVVAISGDASPEARERALASGAKAYVTKDAASAQLERALRRAGAAGRTAEAPRDESPPQQPVFPRHREELTWRQTEIVRMLASGHTRQQIGRALDISSKTVDVHRTRIFERLQLGGLADLTRYAVRKGLVRP